MAKSMAYYAAYYALCVRALAKLWLQMTGRKRQRYNPDSNPDLRILYWLRRLLDTRNHQLRANPMPDADQASRIWNGDLVPTGGQKCYINSDKVKFLYNCCIKCSKFQVKLYLISEYDDMKTYEQEIVCRLLYPRESAKSVSPIHWMCFNISSKCVYFQPNLTTLAITIKTQWITYFARHAKFLWISTFSESRVIIFSRKR